MQNILITGGAGFIGGNFVHYWVREHPSDCVVVLDALTYAGNLSTIDALRASNQIDFVHGDITDAPLVQQLLADRAIDTIVHFAAESHVDRSIVEPGAFVRTNVVGTQVLLDAARAEWRDGERWRPGVRFHHVSTDEVYGSLRPHDPPFTERTPYAPNSPYSASKAAADHLVRAYHHTYGLRTTTSNCSNNYGPLQFPEKLIPLTIVKILGAEAVPVYGDGSNVRDWLHVSDHCRGIELILARGRAGEVYNLGGECERRNIDLVRTLCAIIDARVGASAALRERYPHTPAAR